MLILITLFVAVISTLNTAFLIQFMYNKLIADHYGIAHLSFLQVLVCYIIVGTLLHSEAKPITDYGTMQDHIVTAFAKAMMLYIAAAITIMIH